MRTILFVKLTMVALSLTLVACATLPKGPGGAPMGRNANNTGELSGIRSRCKSPSDEIRKHLAETAISLNLTPRQVVLWEKYQEGVGSLITEQFQLNPYQVPHRTALQQINGKVDAVRNRLAEMEVIYEWASALYQSLDEPQKIIADQRLPETIPALNAVLVCALDNAEVQGERSGSGHVP